MSSARQLNNHAVYLREFGSNIALDTVFGAITGTRS
jgi:hypothetical protein